MSFHFTQSCAFIAYSICFYGLLFVFYWGKDTKKMELARGKVENLFMDTNKNCTFVVEKS